MSLLNSLFGARQKAVEMVNTPLELVTYAAGLASNPDDISPMLDVVRSMTAKLPIGQTPTSKDEAQLLGTYLRLETYLTTKEPLRTFTKMELRKRIADQLLTKLHNYEASQKTLPQS